MKRPRTAAAVTASSAALILVAACSGSSDSGAKDLGPGAPAVGQCRTLTAADINPTSNNSPRVPCSKPHTAVTIAVGGFRPSQVTNKAVSHGLLAQQALQRCTTDWRKTVGGTVTAQHISLAALAYYLPTAGQLSAGARWYRCDLVIGGQQGLPLQPLPPKVQGILDGNLPDALTSCRTAPDFTSGRVVPCTKPHVLRAVGTAPLPDRATYPGKAALQRASAAGCRTVIARWLNGRVSGGDAYQWPDRTGWEILGDRVATCWTVTTR